MAFDASTAPKVQAILRELLPRQSARAAAPQSDWWGEGRQPNAAIWKPAHVILHVLQVCVPAWMQREVVSAGCEGGKELGFWEEASYCPCLRLLIYELEKEISHLSLFIMIFFFFLFLNEIKLPPGVLSND